jgi:hypothetical protein
MELGYMFWALGELESMKTLSLSLGCYVTQPIVADQHETPSKACRLMPQLTPRPTTTSIDEYQLRKNTFSHLFE